MKPAFKPPIGFGSLWGIIVLAMVVLIIGLLVAGTPADWRTTDGFLGTGASRMADVTVVAYVFLLLPAMIMGGALAVNKQFVPYHQLFMSFIVIVNWGLIAFTMYSSFDYVATSDTVPDTFSYQVLPFLHAGLGITAQVFATILMLRMWLESSLPKGLRFRVKTLMRLTLLLWLTTAVLGIAMYILWYDVNGDSGSADDAIPAVTPEATEEADDTTPEPAVTPEVTEEAPDTAPEATEAAPVATEDAGEDDTPEPAETEEADN